MLCAVYKCFVLFIVFVISFSLVKTDSFPDKTNLSEPDPFSLKYDFMVHQNVLLSVTSFKFKFLKYCYLRFLNLDLCMIVFLKFFVMIELLLCLNIFTLIGACLFRTPQKAVSNSLYAESLSFSSSLFNAILKCS